MPASMTGLQFASALSTSEPTEDAVAQVITSLRSELWGPADLVLAFVTPHHRTQIDTLRQRLREALEPGVLLAVTAGGVIGVRRETEETAGLSVLAARLPGVELRPFAAADIEPKLKQDPQVIRAMLSGSADSMPRGVVLIADPFSTPVTSMLPALTAALPGVPVVGGMASGARQPGGNRLLLNGDVHTQGFVGVALNGAIRVDSTVSQGCRPVGKPLVITKAKRNVVMELGGRPALHVARELLDTVSSEDRELLTSNGWHLGRVINEYKDRFGRGDFLIRGIVGVDPSAGYVAVADTQTRVGQTVQFHVRDQKSAREDFALLLEAQKLHGSAGGALLFSCNGRGTHLFSEPNVDACLVGDALADMPMAGFFAAGEIGPVGKENFLHGHTASLAVIRAE